VIRNSYKGHYRRMVPEILQRLEFCSNNERHRPIIQALDLLKRYADSNFRPSRRGNGSIDDIVRGLWREAVFEKDAKGRQRVNRSLTRYASWRPCATSCAARRSGWSAPTATATQTTISGRLRGAAHSLLSGAELPLEADRFIANLQAEMREALRILDAACRAILRQNQPEAE